MNTIANIGSPTHWFILIVVCLVIFGAKRLPDLARNLGKGMGEFKKVRKEFEKELAAQEKKDEDEEEEKSPEKSPKKKPIETKDADKKDGIDV